jgi:protein involved in sex pheromone biosynthesis
MKKILLMLLLVAFVCPLFSQDDEMKQMNAEIKKSTEKLKEDMEKYRVSKSHFDSILKQRSDSMQSIQAKNFAEQNNRNLDAFMVMQKERQQQQTKELWFKAGTFIAMLLVFIYGFVQRKKLKNKEK